MDIIIDVVMDLADDGPSQLDIDGILELFVLFLHEIEERS